MKNIFKNIFGAKKSEIDASVVLLETLAEAEAGNADAMSALDSM